MDRGKRAAGSLMSSVLYSCGYSRGRTERHRVPGLRDKAMSLSGELPNRPVDAPGDVSTSMSVVAGSGPQTSIKRTEVLYAPRHHSGLGRARCPLHRRRCPVCRTALERFETVGLVSA
jgi:hypothetical protein